MFCHRGKQLFLSVYVDDFKMAGIAKNLAGAWKEIGKFLELEPPTEFHGGTYLGQVQYDVEVDNSLVQKQKERWDTLYCDVRGGEYDSSLGNMTAKDQRHKAENPKTSVDIPAPNGILDSILEDVEPLAVERMLLVHLHDLEQNSTRSHFLDILLGFYWFTMTF